LRHGHGCIPIRVSLITEVPQITIVTSAKLLTSMRRPPRKGVTCRRVVESHRYRWRRRPRSDSALRSASRRRPPPSRAPALPRQPNLPLTRPPLHPCPRRLAACPQDTGPPMPMNARRYPSWVSCREPSSTPSGFLHVPPGCKSKQRWCLLPLLPPRVTNRPPTLFSRLRLQPHLRRRHRRLERHSSAG
jgi:hypothetical protein